jgi:Sugar (and other) transporter
MAHSIRYSAHSRRNDDIWVRVILSPRMSPQTDFFRLLFTRESPRWLATKGRTEEAILNLAFLRRTSPSDPELIAEFAEIEAAVEEEREARKGLGLKEAFLAPGNRIRFLIAFVIFLLQQFSGQNSVGFYAPLIFQVSLYHKFVASPRCVDLFPILLRVLDTRLLARPF